MGRNFAVDDHAPRRSAASIACLAFILLLAIAFWAVTLWLGSLLLKLGGVG